MNWRERAACLDLPLEMFFPKPGPRLYGLTKQAKAVCASCPVRVDCLEFALTFVRGKVIMNPGIYGGTTEQERWEIARQRMINR